MRSVTAVAERGGIGNPEDGVPLSVVIPTRGRPDKLAGSITSALQQTTSVREVIVVVDGPDDATTSMLDQMDDARVRVLNLPRSLGPAGARNAGVAAATSEWIAFLDDDDCWHPTKVRAQWQVLAATEFDNTVVVATGIHLLTEEGALSWPRRAPDPGEAVADYLFVRTSPGEGVLQTSTLMFSKALADACPLPLHLKVHEDWDWFLSLEARGARFEVVLEPLVEVDGATDRASASRSVNWETSLAWAMTRSPDLGPRAFSGFMLTEVGRAVARAKDRRTALAIALLAARGNPRARDYARFFAMQVLSERTRWQWGGRLVRARDRRRQRRNFTKPGLGDLA